MVLDDLCNNIDKPTEQADHRLVHLYGRSFMKEKKRSRFQPPGLYTCWQGFLILLLIAVNCFYLTQVLVRRDTYMVQFYDPGNQTKTIDVQIDDPDVLEQTFITKEKDYWLVGFRAKNPGITDVHTIGTHYDGEQRPNWYEFEVTDNGFLYRKFPFDFNGWEYVLQDIIVSSVLLFIILLGTFARRVNNNLYTYQTPQVGGLMIFSLVIAGFSLALGAVLLPNLARYGLKDIMIFSTSMDIFLICALPFIFLFALALTISNLELIRKEGFRIVNLLGIGISFVIFFGVLAFLLYANRGGDALTGTAHLVYLKTVFVVKALIFYGLSFMLSSMICGLIAAKRIPKRNVDYIIILGCGIRPDGTLYPLIQSRVDKALEFWKRQLEETGKKAVFIPSGGQGSDEIISEGQAMKNYLLQQGIEEECILAETESVNTLENMAFSKRIINWHSSDAVVVFSTSNYHVFRSGIFATQAGLKATGIGSKTRWYFWPNAFVREFIGMMFASWKFQLMLFGGLSVLMALVSLFVS